VRAIEQLELIRAYIYVFNPQAADRLADRLTGAAASLDTFPGRGRPEENGIRELTNVPPYVIRYRIIGDEVLITAIKHGRQES
jgi:toxin ParE1/3/4